jgi:Wiskott-Aldrich syndrome protein
VKFSDLLGEPDPEETPAAAPAERPGAPTEPDPITVFAPVPEPDRAPPAAVPPVPSPSDADATIPVPPVPPPVNPPFDPVNPPLDPVLDAPPPDPTLTAGGPAGRSDLASLNVHQPAPAPEARPSSVTDQLAGLDEVVDDLLPPRRGRR